MIKKMKRFAAIIVATVSIGVLGISAYAAMNAFYSFKFSGHGGVEWTTGVKKENSNDYAFVSVEDGDLSEESYSYIAIYNDPSIGNTVTDSIKLTKVDMFSYIKYLKGPIKSSTYYLGGFGSYYGSNYSGNWIP